LALAVLLVLVLEQLAELEVIPYLALLLQPVAEVVAAVQPHLR
jgi:hypothetical protein